MDKEFEPERRIEQRELQMVVPMCPYPTPCTSTSIPKAVSEKT